MFCREELEKIGTMSVFNKHPLLTLIVLGLLIRIPLSLLFTHTYDTYYWGIIQENLESGNGLYGLTGYYYSPVWGYFMAVIGYFSVSALGIGTLGAQSDSFVFVNGIEWEYYTDLVANPAYSLVYKSVFTITDILISLILYKIVQEYTGDSRKATGAFAMWWLCPLTIYTANVHVMFDSLPILVMLLSTYFLLKGQYFIAGSAYAIAAITKLFPAYLLFIFVAYILAKNPGNLKKGLWEIMYAAAGAVMMVAVVFLPNILEGNFMDSLGFITNRVGAIGEENADIWNIIRTNGYFLVVLLQPFVLLLQLIFSWKMYRSKENTDRVFFQMAMLSSAAIFLWTPTPTYLMVILPFLIMYCQVEDRSYRLPYVLLAIFATGYAIVMQNFSDLIPTSAYLGLISVKTVRAGIEFMNDTRILGISFQNAINILFGLFETLAIYSIFILWLTKYRRRNASV